MWNYGWSNEIKYPISKWRRAYLHTAWLVRHFNECGSSIDHQASLLPNNTRYRVNHSFPSIHTCYGTRPVVQVPLVSLNGWFPARRWYHTYGWTFTPAGSVWRDVLVKEANVRVALGATKVHNYVFIIIIRKNDTPRNFVAISTSYTLLFSYNIL